MPTANNCRSCRYRGNWQYANGTHDCRLLHGGRESLGFVCAYYTVAHSNQPPILPSKLKRHGGIPIWPNAA